MKRGKDQVISDKPEETLMDESVPVSWYLVETKCLRICHTSGSDPL